MTPSPLVRLRLLAGEVPSLSELLAAGHATFHRPDREVAFYAAAWAFVHMLKANPDLDGRLGAFIDDIAGGATAQVAWDKRFAGVSFRGLANDYSAYVRRLELHSRRVVHAVPAAATELAARPLSDGDVHLLWARIRPWDRRENIVKAGHDLGEVRRQDVGGPDTHYWLSLYERRWRHFDRAEQELRRALSVVPNDPRYLHALAKLLDEDDDPRRPTQEQLAAVLKKLEHLRASPEALAFIARWHLRRGERDLGMAFARRAVAEGPDCWQCVDTLAIVESEAKIEIPLTGGDDGTTGRKTVLFVH